MAAGSAGAEWSVPMQQAIDFPAARTAELAIGAPPEPVIELTLSSRRFGELVAVGNVTRTVPSGRVNALSGPDKTTTIGLKRAAPLPASGSARLFGAAPADLRARARTGAALQEFCVPMTLRTKELIDLFRSYCPNPPDARTVLDMAGLDANVGACAGDPSGGRRGRRCFGLTVCGDPHLLSLDEPSAGLDVETRRTLWDQVRALLRSGKTIITTTRYLEEAHALADRVVVIDRDRIAADDAPAGIKGRTVAKRVRFSVPATASSNLFDGPWIERRQRTGGSVTSLTGCPGAALSSPFDRGAELTELEVTGAPLGGAFISLTHTAEGVL